MQIRKRAFFTGVFCVLLLAAGTSCRRDSSNRSMDELETLFRNIPDTVQTSVYWYWMSDNISKEGVVRDLRAMKEAGINRAFIGNIGYHSTPYGKVKIFSDEWWDILHTALKTATELNIQIGIFNSPGWSQSGGPWVKPAQAMRYLSASETIAEGGKTISLKLQKPHPDFQDVNVLAFPYQEDHTAKATLRSEPAAGELAVLTDGDTTKSVTAPAGEKWTLDLDFPQAVTARSVSVYPAHHGVRARVEIQAAEGSLFHPVKSFVFDRSNDALNVGFDRHAPVVIALPAVQAKRFRLVFSEMTPQFGLTEVFVSPLKKMERYTEKSLAKMFPTPFPMWDAYLWPDQPDAHDGGLAVQPARVIDISRYMDSSGTLKWTAPAGKWVILRNGMAPTGVVNDPASPEATGLEVDKMNADHLAPHFDAFLGEIMRRVPAEDRKTWKVVVQDSYEKGGQNWTDGFIEKFKKEYGYDPKPFIPVLRGYVVGNADMSDRFLWDLRRFVADRVAYDYVGGLRKISHENGLTTWLENYGHWGFPGEFLQYGGQSDEIGGEFWSEGDLGNIENRAASSSAHIYGKIKVSAESFTAGGNAYARYPALMKQRGDRFFTEGINNTLLHVYIEQPYEDKWPGVNADFSSEFNRHNTWFPFMPMFTQYLKRCNLMLQQGHYVADVAYFIGEDVPKMTGTRDPEIPQGYSYDYINAEALQTRIKVKDGRMNLPDGIAYKILVLPKLKTMRPELLKRLSQMVRQGAVVLGPKPERSPSLAGGGKADAEVRRMAAELWGNVDGQKVKFRQVGKGMIMSGLSLDEALEKQHIAPDCRIVPQDSALFIHRKLAGGDMYFISNQRGTQIDITPQFRLSGKAPELWD
ncbi:MAG: glycoside hydrolase family 2, partial [Mucilaginibacter polytrichastri]|nr:glycoside hydrolase family 2 [Mucilaginibacter polytrichastri]